MHYILSLSASCLTEIGRNAKCFARPSRNPGKIRTYRQTRRNGVKVLPIFIFVLKLHFDACFSVYGATTFTNTSQYMKIIYLK